MLHRYSDKTLAALIEFLGSDIFTATDLDVLFLSVSAHEFDTSGRTASKLKKAITVIMRLYSERELDTIEKLLDEVIRLRKAVFEDAGNALSKSSSTESDHSNTLCKNLLRSLKIDGYEFKNGKIVSSEKLEPELQEEISILSERLQSISAQDVQNNLAQADENFVKGNYESCNAMLRTALESTLKHIAIRRAGKLENIPKRNPRWTEPAPVDIRDFLFKDGFFTDDEHKYIGAFYGYASPNGSHPGISSSAESRLRRLMIVAIIQYCLEKAI